MANNSVTNNGLITAGGYGVAFVGGGGPVAGQALDNFLDNAATGAITGDTAAFFGAGTGNRVLNAGDLIGLGGTAIRFTSGVNEAEFLGFSSTVGNVEGGAGDDTFILHNSAHIEGTLAGNGQDGADTLKLDFVRVLPNEYAMLSALPLTDGGFTFRFQDYAYTGIEAVDLSNLLLSDFGQQAGWPNQMAMGLALDNLPFMTPDLDAFLALVDAAPDIDVALRQMTPEMYDIARIATLEGMRQLDRSATRLADDRRLPCTARLSEGEAEGPVSLIRAVDDDIACDRGGLWLETTLMHGTDRGAGGDALKYRYGARMLRVGVDLPMGGGRQAGLSLGFANWTAGADSFSMAPESDLRADTLFLTRFGLAEFGGGLYVNAQVQLGVDSYEGTRNLQVADDARAAEAAFDGAHAGATVEIGQAVPVAPGLVLEPAFTASYAHVWTGGFDESGAGDLSLHVDGREIDSLQSGLSLGLRGHSFAPLGASLVYHARAGWRHEFLDDNELDARLQAIPDSDVTIEGQKAAGDIFTLEAGLARNGPGGLGQVFFDAGAEYRPQSGALSLNLGVGFRLGF